MAGQSWIWVGLHRIGSAKMDRRPTLWQVFLFFVVYFLQNEAVSTRMYKPTLERLWNFRGTVFTRN